MAQTPPDIDAVRLFYDGIWGSEPQKRLRAIGEELDKVRCYANERKIEDLFSQTVVFLTASSYFAGLVPIIQIESALFVEKEFRNEYAHALAVPAYIEVAGRLHKGVRLWRQYKLQRTTLDDLRASVGRLMAKYRPTDDAPSGMFKGEGYNVMTLVKSLEDRIPGIAKSYNNLSSYVHGGFEEQMIARKISWLSDVKHDSNPVIESHEFVAKQLREVAFDDFSELLQITRPLRTRYDDDHRPDAEIA